MLTILIVDDEPVEGDLLRSMLEDDDYRFETASTGKQVREIVGRQGPDIAAVLMDWILPDADGMELLGWMKDQPALADVEIVVHSAEFAPENIRKAIEFGAYYFLTKPFDEPQLEAIIRAAVQSLELKRKLAEKVEETQDAFRLLEAGTFHVKTIREAELLAVHLASAAGTPDACVGLLELLVNAIEHGNLGIGYEDKGRLLAEGKLTEERRRRLAQAEFSRKKVSINVRRRDRLLEVKIRDEGPGFDFRRYMKLDKSRMFDTHGRGVLMATATLTLEFTPPGNQVRVRLPVRN